MATTLVCEHCGSPFGWVVQRIGQRKRYCPPCAVDREKMQKLAYAHSDEGKAATRRATAKWVASAKGSSYLGAWYESEVGQASRLAAGARFAAKPERQEYGRQWYRNAYRTRPDVRAKRLAEVHERRGVEAENAYAVGRAIAEGSARCYSCGARATDVEHVLPISLAKFFGLLEVVDDYVAPMCRCCHKRKTRQDISDLRRVRFWSKRVNGKGVVG